MKIETTAFGGWANCLRVANDHAELIITLDVGPRILSYQHLPGKKNIFKINTEEQGKSGEDHFVVRGGIPGGSQACANQGSITVRHTSLRVARACWWCTCFPLGRPAG